MDVCVSRFGASDVEVNVRSEGGIQCARQEGTGGLEGISSAIPFPESVKLES